MGSYKFNLSCLGEKMRFKYVESKMIAHAPNVSDPEQMPWEKYYPENVKCSGYQRPGNFGNDPSTESPQQTLLCFTGPEGLGTSDKALMSEGWPQHLPFWGRLLRSSSLNTFLLGWATKASRKELKCAQHSPPYRG